MEDNRKRYSIVCPSCEKQMYACKSIFYEMGLEELLVRFGL